MGINSDLQIFHPVRIAEELTSGYDDPKSEFFREKLDKAISDLDILFDPECTRLDALKAWNKVFNHRFFEDLIEEEEAKPKAKLAAIPTVLATKPWLDDEI